MGFEMMHQLRDAKLPLPPGCVVRHDLSYTQVSMTLDSGRYFAICFAVGERQGLQIAASGDGAEAERLYEEIVREVEAGQFKIHFHDEGHETIQFMSQDLTRRLAETRGTK